MRNKLLGIVVVTGIILLLFVACGKSEISFDIDSIKISIINTSELDGGTYYTLQLYNDSKQTIKHIDIFWGYTLTEVGKKKTNSTSFMLPSKPDDNAINITSGEKRIFIVFWPNEIFKNEMFDKDRINLHIIGYVENMDTKNRFEKNGGLKFFSNE